jgi:hypothetical protein
MRNRASARAEHNAANLLSFPNHCSEQHRGPATEADFRSSLWGTERSPIVDRATVENSKGFDCSQLNWRRETPGAFAAQQAQLITLKQSCEALQEQWTIFGLR